MTRIVVAGSAILFCVVGCKETTIPVKVVGEDSPYQTEGRIQFEQSQLANLIDVVRVDPQSKGQGLLHLIVTLRNKTSKPLWVECRTTFLDSRGHVLEQTNWEAVYLDARTVTEYTCTSLGPKAVEYQMLIRRPAESSLHKP